MTPLWWHRPLRLGDTGPDVVAVQTILGGPVGGVFDKYTHMLVRGAQTAAGIPPDGVVDEATAQAIGPRATDALVPDWYKGTPLLPGTQGFSRVLPHHDEAWVRRFQGNHSLTVTGFIDEDTARALSAAGEVV